MQRWEYAIVTGIEGQGPDVGGRAWHTSYPRCFKLGVGGLELVTDFQYFKKAGTTEANVVAAFIAKLGSEGWELAGVSSGVPIQAGLSTTRDQEVWQTLYFKRLLP